MDGEKEQLIGNLSEAHDDLLIAADVAVTRGDPLDHGWGVREVLAHIAAWETEAARRIPELTAGAINQDYDIDGFNAAAITAAGEASLPQVRAQLEDAHSRLVALLDGLPADAFTKGNPARQWTKAMTRHSAHHARELSEGHIDSTE